MKVEQTTAGLQLSLLERYEPPHWLTIVADRLEDCPRALWVLGIDAEARLDGGVAAAVAVAAGPGYQDSLREGLAQGGREPGRVVFTESFNLRSQRVFRLAHIVTLPRPSRDELVRALERVLAFAPTENLHWIAMPALGCGAAGFQAGDVAGPLLEALARVKDHFVVTLCLPRDAEREAFTKAARSRGLIR